jgi:hypothetical protein
MAEGYDAYVRAKGLSPVVLSGFGVTLDEYTPMMSIGPSGSRADGFAGSILDGLPATLLHSSYAETSDQDRDYTLAVATINEAVAFARNLSCRDRRVQDDLAHTAISRFGDSREVELESIGFDRRFALQAPPGIDASWLRQLFSPSMIDKLSTSAPDGFCFELNEGHFCAAIPGKVTDAATLDAFLATASQVVSRIRNEATEGAGHASQGARREIDKKFERLLGKVKFDQPPPDVETAADRYVGVAIRRPGAFFRALGYSLRHGPSVIILLLVVAAAILLGANAAASVNLAAWLIPAALASLFVIWINIRRQAKALATSLGEEAFVRGYASSRGLQIVDPGGFQAEHARLQFPGAVRHALVGTLPGTGVEGAIALVYSGVEKSAELTTGASSALQSSFFSFFGMGPDDDRTYDVVVYDGAAIVPSLQAAGANELAEKMKAAMSSGDYMQALSPSLMREAFAVMHSTNQKVLSDGNTHASVQTSSRRGRSAQELDRLCAQLAPAAGQTG